MFRIGDTVHLCGVPRIIRGCVATATCPLIVKAQKPPARGLLGDPIKVTANENSATELAKTRSPPKNELSHTSCHGALRGFHYPVASPNGMIQGY